MALKSNLQSGNAKISKKTSKKTFKNKKMY